MREWSKETRKAVELRDSLMKSFIDAPPKETMLAICKRLVRLATEHHKLAERACNRSLTEREEKRDAEVEQSIRDICEGLPSVKDQKTGEPKKIRPHFQGDPRGATVKLVMPDGRYDDWGQTGICVPTTDMGE